MGLEGHTTASIFRAFLCQPEPCASHWEVRSTCCCMGEQRENCFLSYPGNARCRGKGNPWGNPWIPSRDSMAQVLCSGYPLVFHRCRVKDHPGLSNPVLPHGSQKMLLSKNILKPCRLLTFAPFIRRLFQENTFLTVRKFPMTNSGWISWSQVMQLPRLFPCRRLPASPISTSKAFFSIYLYLTFLNIRQFLFSLLLPLYLLVFLFGVGLFLQAFFLYAYSDLFNERSQKWAFQPQHHRDDAVFLL